MYSVELLTFSQHPLKSTNLNTAHKIYSSYFYLACRELAVLLIPILYSSHMHFINEFLTAINLFLQRKGIIRFHP
jgi:hypothetical protein